MTQTLSTKLSIIIFANAPIYSYVSGGDVAFIELAKRWQETGHHITVTTPKGWKGYDLCKDYSFNVIPVSPEAGRERASAFAITLFYLIRTAKACWLRLPTSEGILFFSSDFLCDTIPAFFRKRRNPGVRWQTAVYHMIPHPLTRKGKFLNGLLSYISQRLSIFLIKQKVELLLPKTVLLKKADRNGCERG